jgi:hypothetical protein
MGVNKIGDQSISEEVSLIQELPLLGTQELQSARRKEQLNDVELNQLLNVTGMDIFI